MRRGVIMRRWGWTLSALALLMACDDGGSGGTDAGPSMTDMAPPPPPPPDLTGYYRARLDRVGGDCPADVDPGPIRMFYARSTDDTVDLEALAGDRVGTGFSLDGAGRPNACGQPATERWTMSVSAAGKAFAGQMVATQADCSGAPCTAEYTVRAERAGDWAYTEFSTLDLDPNDVAVLGGEVLGNAAVFATAARDGGRIWRLIHDAGVPFLEPIVTDGFRSVAPELAGNNFALTAVARHGARLVVGTWDGSAETLAARGLDLPPGDGFDLWAWDGMQWEALTTDGLGDATREHASALAVFDDALHVGVSGAAGASIWRVDDQTAIYTAQAECERGISDMAVFDGRLYAAVTGCPDGVHVIRLDADGWQSASVPGFGETQHLGASLLATETQLFALTQSARGAALFRYVGDRQWVAEAGDGFGETGARIGGRGLRVHDSDLLIFPVEGAEGGAAWLTQGGRMLRDLTRFIGPAVAPDALSLALSFERRLYLGTRGDDALDPASFAAAPPPQLLRASTLLSEIGSGTLRTARDRAFDAARGADAACHRQARWFNPALEHDQQVEVILPPGVDTEDIVRLPTLYLLHPTGDAEGFLADATPAFAGLSSCLYGRRATIPCDDAEDNRACLARCLNERIPGADGEALVAHLGLDAGVDLPVIERIALVIARYGAGIYVDAPGEALWTAPDGRLGAWQAAIPAVAAYAERCWPLSIRGPEARYVYGFGEGGLAAAAAVGAGVFPAGVAHAPRYDVERLADGALWQGVALSPGGPLLSIIDAEISGCAAQAAACSVADRCGPDQSVMQAGGDADMLARLPAIADALVWLTQIHRGDTAPTNVCADLIAPDCAALPAVCE